MKHGYGEFIWSSGSKFKGSYHKDKKRGYGEMYWADGSLYRGYWEDGVQSGLGIMIFKDGLRKAGFFQENVYRAPLNKMSEFDIYERKDPKRQIPEAFRQEIKEYIGQMQPEDDHTKYVGQEFLQAEMEDATYANALQNMQEMANAPFGPNGMSKEEYAA
jgi:hypothetical protein